MTLKILPLVFLAVAGITLSAQKPSLRQIPLDQGWVFNPSDNPAFADAGLNDGTWRPIKVNVNWDEQGQEELIGYAWYRLRFMLPKGMRDEDKLKEGLLLALGKIDDGDQVFLNGEFLGQNGRTFAPETEPPEFKTGPWDLERVYRLAADDPRIKWGQENLIAVRVVNPNGAGGMYGGGQHIRLVGLKDFVDFQADMTPFTFYGNEVVKTFDMINRSDKIAMSGTLSIEAKGLISGKKVTQNRKTIDLAPGEKMPVNVRLGQRDEACEISYQIVFKDGETCEYRDESPYILTPPVPSSPRINGAAVFGAKPDKPFLYTVAASGDRPMTFSASELPDGLTIDAQTGVITGITPVRGTYKVKITAKNIRGIAVRDLEIISGDRLALTPPMGWNSWNCWGTAVDEEKVVASAKNFVEKGLRDHGWAYINIDDGWQIAGRSPDPKRDSDGNILINNKFPDMARLGRRIHDLGLKFGIYSSPGPLTCGGYTGSYQHEQNDADSYASWGVDFLKYDWCSYRRIANDTSIAELKKPYEVMRDALDKGDRDIVLSLCQYGMGNVWEWGESVGGQLWRTTHDITDTWESMSGIGFSQVSNAPYAKPGSWNDPDMLVIGWVGWGPNLHPTRLRPDEQYTHISLWCLLSAPLLIGCDLTRLDPFTLNLITNDEVLAVNQDALGKQATPKIKEGQIQVWVKELHDGGSAVGIFNLGDETADFEVNFETLGVKDGKKLRDLWRQKDIGPLNKKHSTRISPHGVVLLKVI
ncbi:MAG: putative Ig domain-containing protein [Holophagales bacterium]|jgi:hypothetical protein|nr:putative Ig domain-containing protein [Holophagales bacterium]